MADPQDIFNDYAAGSIVDGHLHHAPGLGRLLEAVPDVPVTYHSYKDWRRTELRRLAVKDAWLQDGKMVGMWFCTLVEFRVADEEMLPDVSSVGAPPAADETPRLGKVVSDEPADRLRQACIALGEELRAEPRVTIDPAAALPSLGEVGERMTDEQARLLDSHRRTWFEAEFRGSRELARLLRNLPPFPLMYAVDDRRHGDIGVNWISSFDYGDSFTRYPDRSIRFQTEFCMSGKTGPGRDSVEEVLRPDDGYGEHYGRDRLFVENVYSEAMMRRPLKRLRKAVRDNGKARAA